ncbi:MAG: DEAD/DEAH box helicase, partial [Candidatus Pacebacteria bacterium]|nr:DEAD/DEAH box helicase [Candidatus Paceibacterota bacterium]
MYSLDQTVDQIRGVGDKTAEKLANHQIKTVKDLLLYLPLRYEDLSQISTINQLQVGQTYTIKARLISISDFYRSGRRMTSAVLEDQTGQTKAIWFNNRYIKSNLKKGKEYYFSGEYSKYRSLTQPAYEDVKKDTIHTGRLVPIYSSSLPLKQGKLRRLFKEILDHLGQIKDPLTREFKQLDLFDLNHTFASLHFPDEKERVVLARERLALEELVSLIKKSEQLKKSWNNQQPAAQLKSEADSQLIPEEVPFELTNAQKTATSEIIHDLTEDKPMNRLLIGDVGSGKTVVAALAAKKIIQAGFSAALIAPTQILAEQHQQSLSKILPSLPTKLLTAKTSAQFEPSQKPTLYIGTHAVINQLPQIKPGLIIYDEQHRFGVKQRSEGLGKISSETST